MSQDLPFEQRAFVSPSIAGQRLNKGRTKIFELIKLGKLRSVKDGPKKRSVDVRSILEYEAELRRRAAEGVEP